VERQENEEFERLLRKYQELLQDKSIPPAQRATFEKMRESLADALLQEWLSPGS